MELTLRGTGGGPRPSRHRFPTAQAIKVGERVIAVDAGNGVAQQMARAGLDTSALSDLFITHLHVDHAADLGNLPLTAWIDGRTEPMRVFGPEPTAASFWHLIDGYEDDLVHRTASTGRPDFRSMVTAHDVAEAGVVLADEGVTLRLGNSAYDPTDAMGKMMFNMLATFAEFEADLIKMRTREGMRVATA